MAQFDVHPNPVGEMADMAPFVLDLQDGGLAAMPTRLVAPLVRQEEGVRPARHLTPVMAVDGERLMLMPHLMAAVPAKSLGRPIGSLADRRDEIVAALDFLFTGI